MDQKEDVYTLSTGDVVLRWPECIIAEEAEDLDDWLEIMRRKLKQAVCATMDGVITNLNKEAEGLEVSAIESDPRPYCS